MARPLEKYFFVAWNVIRQNVSKAKCYIGEPSQGKSVQGDTVQGGTELGGYNRLDGAA